MLTPTHVTPTVETELEKYLREAKLYCICAVDDAGEIRVKLT